MRIPLISTAAVICTMPASGQEWISLGGSLNGEMDLQSVGRIGSLPTARMRFSGQTAQGRVTMTMELGAMCAESYLYMLDGWITSSWSPTIAAMPDVPPEERVIWIPTENKAFTHLFIYLCNG